MLRRWGLKIPKSYKGELFNRGSCLWTLVKYVHKPNPRHPDIVYYGWGEDKTTIWTYCDESVKENLGITPGP